MRSGFENDLQLAYTSALLDQLEARGADVSKQHRRLRSCQAAAQINVEPPLYIHDFISFDSIHDLKLYSVLPSQ